MRKWLWVLLSFAVTQYLIPSLGAAVLAVLLGSIAGLTWYSIIGIAAASAIIGWSGIQLLVEFDERVLGRRPMRPIGEDEDQGYWRLIVKNPNRFPVRRVYVQLEVFETVVSKGNLPHPSKGYRFPWTSWGTEGGSLNMDFPPMAEMPVDIVARPPFVEDDLFFFVHLAESKERPVRVAFWQTEGTYRLALSLCSEDLPIGSALVEVTYADKVLAMRLISDTEDPQRRQA